MLIHYDGVLIMGLTVKDALSMDILNDAVVISGKRGLYKEIEFITVMEVPDIFDWVSEGELILTTGYPFKDSPLELVGLIKDLSTKRVACIAFKMKRFIDELPQEVLQIADELDFPLIALPPGTRFAKIISELMSHIVNEDYLDIKRSVEIQNNMTSLIISGGKFQEIALMLSKICGCDVEIKDSMGTVLAKVLKRTQVSSGEGSNQLHTYVEKVMISKDIIGRIELTSHDRPFNRHDYAATGYAAKILAMIMIKHETSREKEQKLRIDFLNEVTSGKIESDDVLHERACSFGFNMHIPYISYVFIPADHENGRHKYQKSEINRLELSVNKAFASIGKICISWSFQNKVSVLCPVQPKIDDIKVRSIAIAQSIYKYLSDNGNIPVEIGIGTYHPESLNIYKSYMEAVDAASYGKLIPGKVNVYHYDDLGIYQLLLRLVNTENSNQYIKSFLGRLIEYDQRKNTQLVLTLEHLISCGNLREAAKIMFVHPKTMALRKEKIERILEISFENTETKEALSAAIKLHRISSRDST